MARVARTRGCHASIARSHRSSGSSAPCWTARSATSTAAAASRRTGVISLMRLILFFTQRKVFEHGTLPGNAIRRARRRGCSRRAAQGVNAHARIVIKEVRTGTASVEIVFGYRRGRNDRTVGFERPADSVACRATDPRRRSGGCARNLRAIRQHVSCALALRCSACESSPAGRPAADAYSRGGTIATASLPLIGAPSRVSPFRIPTVSPA